MPITFNVLLLVPIAVATMRLVREEEAAWRADGAVAVAAKRDAITVASNGSEGVNDSTSPFEYPAEIPVPFKRPPEQGDSYLSRFVEWWSTQSPLKAKNGPLPFPYDVLGLAVHVLIPKLESAPNLSYWILIGVSGLVLSGTLLYIVASSCARRSLTSDTEPLEEDQETLDTQPEGP